MKNRIRTIKDLEEKQHSLKVQAEVSKQLFFESFGNTRRYTTDFLLKGVILPAGAVGLAAWGAKRFFGSNGTENEGKNKHAKDAASESSGASSSSILSKLLPVGLALLNAYINKRNSEEEEA